MIDEVKRLIRQYALKGIIVDTNILLLYFVGALGRKKISQFKRTNQFDADDYEILVSLWTDRLRYCSACPKSISCFNGRPEVSELPIWQGHRHYKFQ